MKKLVTFFLFIFSAIGSYIPMLFGENFFGGWSIAGGFVGGVVGIWFATWVAKRYGY